MKSKFDIETLVSWVSTGRKADENLRQEVLVYSLQRYRHDPKWQGDVAEGHFHFTGTPELDSYYVENDTVNVTLRPAGSAGKNQGLVDYTFPLAHLWQPWEEVKASLK